MTLYLIPGLGADHRVFGRLRFPEGARIVYLDWIPQEQGEDLRQYALRMAERIDRSAPFALVGLSMGGMVATEIAQVLPAARTILISSATARRQLAAYERALGRLHADALFPGILLKQPTPIHFWLLGAYDDTARDLVRAMQGDADPGHFKWSLRAILDWTNEAEPPGLVRIHGSNDHLIPIRNLPEVHHRIEGAGHLCLVTHAAEVSAALEKVLGGF
ncbi:alpha/beta hydrolase [Flaviaesturariibacter amylovorans]|uniref:AB hydrolase-1 domain-containing protein n=1 Tax=Flaviaesturariibacter amylovorans TaxID=1084520 RepID=A0ABP8HUE9_9BACT